MCACMNISKDAVADEDLAHSVSIAKQRIQTVVVLVGLGLMAAKFVAFFATNSAAILTDAMESIVNVIAGFISLYSIRLASRPKDFDHPFGHGKIELISASIEGLMISAAGAMIIYEGVCRLISPVEIESLDFGIGVVAFAGVVNYVMGSVSIHFGRLYNSPALVAGGRHLHSDTYSTIGLVVGLAAVSLSNITWIDSALALLFGAVILSTGISVLRKTVANLTDEADEQNLKKLLDVVSKHQEKDWIDVHNLKMISYGSETFVDCDLTMPWFYTIEQGHNLSERLKKILEDSFGGNATVSIHFDSCGCQHCSHCMMDDCKYRKEPFAGIKAMTIPEITGTDEFMKSNRV